MLRSLFNSAVLVSLIKIAGHLEEVYPEQVQKHTEKDACRLP